MSHHPAIILPWRKIGPLICRGVIGLFLSCGWSRLPVVAADSDRTGPVTVLKGTVEKKGYYGEDLQGEVSGGYTLSVLGRRHMLQMVDPGLAGATHYCVVQGDAESIYQSHSIEQARGPSRAFGVFAPGNVPNGLTNWGVVEMIVLAIIWLRKHPGWSTAPPWPPTPFPSSCEGEPPK